MASGVCAENTDEQTKQACAPMDESTGQLVTYGTLLRFFLPLAITPLLISCTHSIVNAALARLPLPVLSIALFSVVKAVTNAVKAPDMMVKSVVVSLGDNREDLRLVLRFSWALCLLLLTPLLVFAYTPLGALALRAIIGQDMTRQQIELGYLSLRIVCFLPVVETLRNTLQGITIRTKRTPAIAMGTVVRLVAISVFLYWAVESEALPGLVAGSLAWTVGIGIEGVCLLLYLKRVHGGVAATADLWSTDERGVLQVSSVLRFFLPLGFMMTLVAALQPVIQGGVARVSADPPSSLTAYSVAWGLILIIGGPLRNLHQCSLVYAGTGQDERDDRTVARFVLTAGAAMSLLTLLVGASSVGRWIMTTLIGVPPEVAQTAAWTLACLTPYPLLRAFRELHWGLLMKQRRTGLIGLGKAASLAGVTLVALFAFPPLLRILPWDPALLGALAFVFGEALETTIVYHRARRQGRVFLGLRREAGRAGSRE